MKKCDWCEEAKATFNLTLTDMQGLVLDEGNYCLQCLYAPVLELLTPGPGHQVTS